MMQSTAAKVLVVEDEALLLFSISDELTEAGFEVFEASNAAEALEQLEAHKDIALIFTDVDMPGDMDGLKLSAYVRDRWPPIRIVVTSGKLRPPAHALPEEGVFIAKPYTTANVVAALRSLHL
jgi:two-component system, response regulator PdtaR